MPDNGPWEIVPIRNRHRQVFDRLVQGYEAEFSSITGKVPGEDGLFALDTQLDDGHIGYMLYLNNAPAGFSIIALKDSGCFEVCEFYIVPVFRLRHLGYLLAADVFDRHRGTWEVKQIAGADRASAFWRRAIGRYTGGRYAEELYNDPYWGVVTCQTFRNELT